MQNEFDLGVSRYVEDGHISHDGFFGYHKDLSCVLPWEKDTYFCLSVSKVWGLKADLTQVADSRLRQLEDILFEKIR